MVENKDMREREKVVRKIEKTAESIRKKHRALKTGKIKEDIATKSHFKPIIEPQKIIDNFSKRGIKNEPHGDDVETSFVQKDMIRSNLKRKRENTSVDHALSKLIGHTSNDVMDSPAITSTPRTTIEAAKPIKDEDVFETTNDLFTTSVQHQMQTSEGRKALSQHLGPLGQKYIGNFLGGGRKNKIIDTVYDVRLDKDEIMMLGSLT